MLVEQISRIVEVHFPENWREIVAEHNRRFDASPDSSLLSDVAQTLLDSNCNPIPGINELLETFRERGQINRIVVASGMPKNVYFAKQALRQDLVDEFTLIDFDGPKPEYAQRHRIRFVLEDDIQAWRSKRFICVFGLPVVRIFVPQVQDFRSYTPEVSDALADATLNIRGKLRVQ